MASESGTNGLFQNLQVGCVGISHRTAEVSVRERFALGEPLLGDAALGVKEAGELSGAVVVSTCNRVEYYFAAADAERAAIRIKDHIRAGDEAGFYAHAGHESVVHLLRVVSGMDSMVPGETEILGQVKKAYQCAVEAGAANREVHVLFQKAFAVAKEVRSQTNITRGPVSVGGVAVDLAEKIFGKLAHCKVMILGAGETAEQTGRALVSRGVRSIFVSNRTHDRAVELATSMGGAALHFDEWQNWAHDVDILVGSTAAPHAVVLRERIETLMGERPARPLFIIDLAVPRDVETSVNELEGVYVYDIDALQEIAERSLAFRRAELVQCEAIIERCAREVVEKLKAESGKRKAETFVEKVESGKRNRAERDSQPQVDRRDAPEGASNAETVQRRMSAQ